MPALARRPAELLGGSGPIVQLVRARARLLLRAPAPAIRSDHARARAPRRLDRDARADLSRRPLRVARVRERRSVRALLRFLQGTLPAAAELLGGGRGTLRLPVPDPLVPLDPAQGISKTRRGKT